MSRDLQERTARGGGQGGRSVARRRRLQILGPKVAPYLFISPFFLIFLGVFLFPTVWSLAMSFQEWNVEGNTWVGLSNYQFVLQSPEVLQSFRNIIWYVVVNNVFQLTIALGIAVLLDAHLLRRFSGPLRVGFFLPNIVSGVVTAILFSIILGAGGVFDGLLGLVGLDISWLQSTQWSKPAVILAGGWRWIGYWVIIIMAGLQSIPDEMYEAAEVEGASQWQHFRFVTLPLLRPVLLFVIMMNTIGTMQLFEEPFLLFSQPGGPLSSASTPVLEIYRLGFQNFDLGAAAAVGWLLIVLIVVITLAQFTIARRRGWTE